MGASARPNTGNRATESKHATPIDAIQAAETIKGTIKDANGQPLPGVSVSIKGTSQGTQSDANGAFSIQANIGDVLIFSYLGYIKQEVHITGTGALSILLAEDHAQLQEVVVTALGVKRSEKSLTYANQVVGSAALNNVKNDNVMNSLNGRVAGVDISPSSSGVGGSVKVILRGSKSVAGTNGPLYVVDGIPITNTSNGSLWGSSRRPSCSWRAVNKDGASAPISCPAPRRRSRVV